MQALLEQARPPIPYGVAVTPDGSKMYVANTDSNIVSVIDSATNMVTATIAVGPSPSRLAASSNRL